MAGIGERDTTPRLGAVAPLRPGDPARIGRYALSGRLGAGGMGTVYLGRAGTGPAVAVKVVHPELADDPEFRARFADEVAAARRVAPFCTARVVDADPAAARPYLVTEFVDGVPLSTAVAEGGPLDESTLHGVALGVAAALAAVHTAGVVHRDLKPGNVLLSLSGPRVIDFGIARALDAARQHTRVGMLVGTPGWMAPEQFRGGGVGPAADIFSWGSLVTYAATGRNPWQAGSSEPSLPPTAQAYKILHDEPELTGLTGSLRRLVESALAKDPARRPTARQLVDALLGAEAAPADPTRAAAGLVERTWTGLPTFPPDPSGPAAGRSGVPGRRDARPGPESRPEAAGPVRSEAGPYGTVAFGTGRPADGRGRPADGRGRPADGRGRPAAGPAPRPPGPPPWSAPTQRGPAPPTQAFAPSTRVMPPGPPVPSAPSPASSGSPVAARPARRSLLRRNPVRSTSPGPPLPPAPADPARPTRRRRFRRKRVLIPVALLVGLALLAPRNETPTSTPPATGSQLGAPVRDGNLEFVVRKLRCGLPTVGTGLLKRTATGQYCVAEVQVTNIKNEARTLYEPLQRLSDSSGDKHRSDVTMRLVFPDQTLWDKIEPGDRVAGTMVFDIPAGRTPVALELHDGPLSGGVKVRVK